ncbi:YggT family protein [Lentilactobacillus kosonis]|uniref:Cell division protein YlmG/Ycf19, YggT family n=1 Tax=Lentilactobacillus kosonis TaxID=2810561 RepID=A0A401FNY5_9LACO|nr:YggT family protein [Lentilactobacillus kosonis]GAY74074.1 cell division protein YlmG/Ycf19, YggT family [Lentilactobacillus kosonis]
MVTIISYIVTILARLINLYMILIMVYALLSWFPGAYSSTLGRWLAKIVEPYQSMFNFASFGMLSFAPVVAILVLYFIQMGIIYLGKLLIGI